MTEGIERIEKMEVLLNRLTAVVHQANEALAQLEDSLADLKELTDYYTSPLWMKDFEADERGEIPSHIRRGVLSEDGVYNMLWEYRCLQDRMDFLCKQDDQ